MTLFVSLERGGSIGSLWHATGTDGDAAGARSSKSMINGTTGDAGDTGFMLGCVRVYAHHILHVGLAKVLNSVGWDYIGRRFEVA
ncbi:unnamed protein product [Heligmosomoides polygyrus]|uniref:Transposase n=1 Tax=Heligmosomoides polygyrus TaxID=6339 RepID=A0A183GSU2_HELPZ|nr:unnamed protein product [Heligmosomoides polygyrus]